MSLNQLKLTPHLLAGLYDKVLVESHAIPVPQPPPLRVLGDNKRHVLIICNNQDIPFLTDDELNQLTSILAACSLGMADVAVINWQFSKNAGFGAVKDQLKPKSVLMFGITPAEMNLPISFPAFQVQQHDGLSFIHAPALAQMINNKEQKMQLWSGLKRMFNI